MLRAKTYTSGIGFCLRLTGVEISQTCTSSIGLVLFVRSGGFYLGAGTAGGPHSGYLGYHGLFWSSRSDSTTTNAHNLYFLASNVNPSNSADRWRGFSLRCLSTVLGM